MKLLLQLKVGSMLFPRKQPSHNPSQFSTLMIVDIGDVFLEQVPHARGWSKTKARKVVYVTSEGRFIWSDECEEYLKNYKIIV